MDPLFLSLTGLAAGAVLAEFVVWECFRTRMASLTFPCEANGMLFRFFTIRRLRIFAVLHAGLLIAMLCLSYGICW